jgi:uncharacterized protein GlcG (DUF336 family)
MSTRIKYATAFVFLVAAGLDSVISQPALSQANSPGEQQAAAVQNCPVSRERLVDALKKSLKPSGGPSNGGFDNNEWASVVARDGTVCAVAFSGSTIGDQWPGSRVISAEKANTANAFSLKAAAISTANLYAGAQPGGFLFGIVATAPVSPDVASGDASKFGTGEDPMIGKRVGGVVVFGGGLALYNDSDVVGGLGVSGDSPCADHNVAWRVRHALGLDHVPAGAPPNKNDGIVYDIGLSGLSKSGFGHPTCNGKEAGVATDLGAGMDKHLLP